MTSEYEIIAHKLIGEEVFSCIVQELIKKEYFLADVNVISKARFGCIGKYNQKKDDTPPSRIDMDFDFCIGLFDKTVYVAFTGVSPEELQVLYAIAISLKNYEIGYTIKELT